MEFKLCSRIYLVQSAISMALALESGQGNAMENRYLHEQDGEWLVLAHCNREAGDVIPAIDGLSRFDFPIGVIGARLHQEECAATYGLFLNYYGKAEVFLSGFFRISEFAAFECASLQHMGGFEDPIGVLGADVHRGGVDDDFVLRQYPVKLQLQSGFFFRFSQRIGSQGFCTGDRALRYGRLCYGWHITGKIEQDTGEHAYGDTQNHTSNHE